MSQPPISPDGTKASHGSDSLPIPGDKGGPHTASTQPATKRFYGIARAILAELEWTALRITRRSRFLSALWYTAASGAFHREQFGVAFGRWRYQNDLRKRVGKHPALRRNIHRLEKALIMRPRKAHFALDYIESTVDYFVAASAKSLVLDAEIGWANDVLREYFAAVAPHPIIDGAREKFLAVYEAAPRIPMIPYAQADIHEEVPSHDALLALARKRRSVRWYRPSPVPRELLDNALEVARLAPSACNRQPFYFRIFEEPVEIRRVGSIPGGTEGFFENFPVLVVVVGQLRSFEFARDRHVIYIDASLAAMSFMLALETLGLSSCPINWPDVEDRERRMERTLELEPDERVIMLISVGYPDPEGKIPFSQKKPLSELRRFN